MNTNKITLSAIVLVALLGLFLTISVAQAQEAAPNASGANGSEESAPAAVGANDSEGSGLIPGGQGSDENEGTGIIPNGNGANNDEVGGTDNNNPSTPGDGDNDNGNGSNGSNSRNRSSGNSVVVANTSGLPVLIRIKNCSYVNDYLKLGGANSASEVSKLQLFLKNSEKIDVDVNGIFDQKTFEAVKAFQAKYVDEIMLPWGVTTPTGQVYYTTKKKINEIFCKSNFSLTAEQTAQIEAYRKGIADGTIELDANGSPVNATGTIPLLPEVGSTGGSQAAAVGSFASKIWGFIKWLFGY